MSVGIFDSGLGGLTVYKAIRQALPELCLMYYSDNAHAPYGEREPADICRLTERATEKLWAAGCELVILACNTASAVALRPIQLANTHRERHVLGVFVPIIESITQRHWLDLSAPSHLEANRIALFATAATVQSGAFDLELARRAKGVELQSQACTGLVDALEAGRRAEAVQLVREYVARLKQGMPDPQVAILGCTHYPLVQKAFADALGADVAIYSQADCVAQSLAAYLARHPERAGGLEADRFFCSGAVSATAELASDILQQQLCFEPF